MKKLLSLIFVLLALSCNWQELISEQVESLPLTTQDPDAYSMRFVSPSGVIYPDYFQTYTVAVKPDTVMAGNRGAWRVNSTVRLRIVSTIEPIPISVDSLRVEWFVSNKYSRPGAVNGWIPYATTTSGRWHTLEFTMPALMTGERSGANWFAVTFRIVAIDTRNQITYMGRNVPRIEINRAS